MGLHKVEKFLGLFLAELLFLRPTANNIQEEVEVVLSSLLVFDRGEHNDLTEVAHLVCL